MPSKTYTLFPKLRMLILGLVLVESLAVIGVTAHLKQTDVLSAVWIITNGADVALAASVISLIVLPLLLFVDHFRHQALLTKVAIEVPLLAFLSILWLSAGARLAEFNPIIRSSCDHSRITIVGRLSRNAQKQQDAIRVFCGEYSAVEGIGFQIFVTLLALCIATVILGMKVARDTNTQVAHVSMARPQEGALPAVTSNVSMHQKSEQPFSNTV